MKHIIHIAIIYLFFLSQPVHSLNTIELETIYEAHVKTLKHTELPHRKLCISFSATPGMGKSHVARLLEDAVHGVRIRADDIRAIIRKLTGKKRGAKSYIRYFFNRYDKPNKLIILDSSVNRQYRVLFPLLDQKKIPYFIIRLDVPFDLIIKRLTQREHGKIGRYLKKYPNWTKQHNAFIAVYPNVYLYPNKPNQDLPEDLLTALARYL